MRPVKKHPSSAVRPAKHVVRSIINEYTFIRRVVRVRVLRNTRELAGMFYDRCIE